MNISDDIMRFSLFLQTRMRMIKLLGERDLMKFKLLILLVSLMIAGCNEPKNKDLSPDGQVIQQLKNAGSNLSKEHPVEFFIYAPNKEAAESIVARIEIDGFKSKVEKSESDELWLVFAVKLMIPNEQKLLKIRAYLEKVASSVGGEYDGWGTPIVK
jgi:regulator of RNase E activity RraB